MKLSDRIAPGPTPVREPVVATTEEVKLGLRAKMKSLKPNTHPAPGSPRQGLLQELLSMLLESLRPEVIFTFLGTTEEVDTRPLIDSWRTQSKTVLVPSIVDREAMVATVFPGWNELVVGALGILSPQSKMPFQCRIDVAVIPGLAFSLTGHRLGYGGGYYDRWLAAHPETLRVGVCFEYQFVAELPFGPRDQGLDYLVTERRIAALAPNPRSKRI